MARGFRIRSIGPELSQNSAVVSAGNHLHWEGSPVTGSLYLTVVSIEHVIEVSEISRIRGQCGVTDAVGADVPVHPIGVIQVGGPNQNLLEAFEVFQFSSGIKRGGDPGSKYTAQSEPSRS